MRSKFIYSLGVLAVLISMVACNPSGDKKEKEPVTIEKIDPALLIGEESKLLLAYLNELGDWVNSRTFPSLIKAISVYENLNNNQLIIDIREKDKFKSGHINGAVNVDFGSLVEYFEGSIVPFEFDKIIIVSEAGQTSSYAACLLRLIGYGNVYSMRWGMSAWNKDFANTGWNSFIGSKYEDNLETNINKKAPQTKLPELKTGKTTGEDILLARVKKLFSEGVEPAHITAEQVFASSSTFYIMNYIRKDKYLAGHIPGSIRYKPTATLGIISEMSTIPSDKPSVVYCGTGHNSGFVTAYLRLFGFDAKTLIYGNNSFMYNKMLSEQASLSWLPFTNKEVNNFEFVK